MWEEYLNLPSPTKSCPPCLELWQEEMFFVILSSPDPCSEGLYIHFCTSGGPCLLLYP